MEDNLIVLILVRIEAFVLEVVQLEPFSAVTLAQG